MTYTDLLAAFLSSLLQLPLRCFRYLNGGSGGAGETFADRRRDVITDHQFQSVEETSFGLEGESSALVQR